VVKVGNALILIKVGWATFSRNFFFTNSSGQPVPHLNDGVRLDAVDPDSAVHHLSGALQDLEEAAQSERTHKVLHIDDACPGVDFMNQFRP
jgi:hypothetical protein